MKHLLFLVLLFPALLRAQPPAKQSITAGEWPAYGRDAGGSRYSPLQEINDKNVAQLRPAWTFHTGELKTYDGTNALSKAAFEATPLMIGHTLYFSTPSDRVFAIDAATGQQQWLFDPKVDLHHDFSEITSRGVTAWPAPGAGGNTTTPKRIFIATIDGRLIALDAATGIPIPSFGSSGTVDLKDGYGYDISVTSPPAVTGNLLIVGSSLGDNQRFDYTKGTVRAYDVLSGRLRWSWDPVPRNTADPAWQTWQGPKAHSTGAANAWSLISCDAANDLVFIPATSPSPDYYGGERLGQNLYGNCIVALRASTGKMVWYFQVVHHDLWDYDIAAQPMLITITRQGKKIPAVAVGTKMGHIFILNRLTGKPLFPVEERKVPTSTLPGEQAWATQPFPVLPAPLGIQHIGTADAWGLTPEDKEKAVQRIALYNNEGIFTPPSRKGSIMTPGNAGGIHWGGMCFDASQNILITNINRLPAIIRMLPRDSVKALESASEELLRAETGRQAGTPYMMKRNYLFTIAGGQPVMQYNPPWGTLVAIDMRTGAQKWEVPLGYMMDTVKYPGAAGWGSLNFGGAIVTAGNLCFVAASMDGHLRAFNTQTGRVLWEYALPAGGQATPMSYTVDGRQYVLIAAGGHGKLGTRMGDAVVAFALP